MVGGTMKLLDWISIDEDERITADDIGAAARTQPRRSLSFAHFLRDKEAIAARETTDRIDSLEDRLDRLRDERTD